MAREGWKARDVGGERYKVYKSRVCKSPAKINHALEKLIQLHCILAITADVYPCILVERFITCNE